MVLCVMRMEEGAWESGPLCVLWESGPLCGLYEALEVCLMMPDSCEGFPFSFSFRNCALITHSLPSAATKLIIFLPARQNILFN